jgi:AcrR family transcriptional regulator
MEQRRPAVKANRGNHAPTRAERARRTREAVIDAARRLFLQDGFAATTIAAIAADAGVSVETIYKTFGGKPGMVRAICRQALAGAGPVPAETRSDDLQRIETDPRTIIRGWGGLTTEVAPRIAPVLLLLRAAAVNDPEMAELQNEISDQRLARMTHNAEGIAEHLRPGLSIAETGIILWTYSSPELYELLVLKQGWNLQRYGTFIADAIIAAVLPSP